MTSPHSPRWCAIALLAALAACSSKADRIDAGLRKAAGYAQGAQWAKANVEVRNVLQLDPKSARAYALAGTIAEGQGDPARAFKAWSTVAELSPGGIDAPLAIVRLRLLVEDIDGAQSGLAPLLARAPRDAGVRTLQAAVLARRGQSGAAIDELRDVLAAHADAPADASLLLAGLLAQATDSPAALQVLEAALARHPDDLPLLIAAANIAGDARAGATDAHQAAQAIGFYRRATVQAPADDALWRAWAEFDARRDDAAGAETVWRAAIAAAPDDDARRIALVDFLRRHGSAATAEHALMEQIAARPRSPALRRRLADLYDDTGRHDDAQRVLVELIAADPAAPAALDAQNHLASRAALAGDRASEAQWLTQTLQANPRDAQALALHGQMLLADGHADLAVSDLRTAAHEHPASAEIVGLLARALRAQGEPQLARDALVDALEARPDEASLRLLLAADMADQGERADADRELRETIRRAPHDPRAYEARARLALAAHDLDGAEQSWRALAAARPGDAGAWLDVAAIRQRRAGDAAALKVFDQGEQALPGVLAIPTARAEWLARAGRSEAAIAQYEQLLQRAPDDALIANNLAWLIADRASDAQGLARAWTLARRFVDSDDAGQLDTLGWIELRLGHAAVAQGLLERALALSPDSALVQMHLGMALHAAGDAQRGDPLVRKALASGQPLPHADDARRLLGTAS